LEVILVVAQSGLQLMDAGGQGINPLLLLSIIHPKVRRLILVQVGTFSFPIECLFEIPQLSVTMAELLLIPGYKRDAACFDNDTCMDLKKRKLDQMKEDECPGSPVPSLYSESSTSSEDVEDVPSEPRKRRKAGNSRRVCFDLKPSTKNLNPSINVYDMHDDVTVDEIWWSKSDLKNIMRREGRLVLDLKLSPVNSAACVASSLKRSINEAFKKCVNEPSAVSQDCPIFEFIKDDFVGETHRRAACHSKDSLTTTRGLERYVAPILGAHRQMVVKSLLVSQRQLEGIDPSLRTQVLGARYEHMCKVAANFAVVMARCDAELASGTTCYQ
jgi:hypothetical protein